MILIADSGSTKTDWKVLFPDGKVLPSATRGFNPFLQNAETIIAAMQEEFDQNLEKAKVEQVHYYGAGCSDRHRCAIVEVAMQQLFPNAKILVNHDLLASARAVCGKEAGIACILGTGSNSCLYDGADVADQVTCMGSLVGDEGSGFHIGKELLRGYFYREMPDDIFAAFEEFYPEGKRKILNQVYDHKRPNVYLASFSKFCAQHKTHPYIQHLIFGCFEEFVRRHVLKYRISAGLKIHFVGSVAFYYQDILKIVLASHNLELGNVLKQPIDNLVEFHRESSRNNQ